MSFCCTYAPVIIAIAVQTLYERTGCRYGPVSRCVPGCRVSQTGGSSRRTSVRQIEVDAAVGIGSCIPEVKFSYLSTHDLFPVVDLTAKLTK